MIIRFMPAGRSFKWLGTYLACDPQAKTSERVAWTHTLNLANDHVPSAVDEMIRTFEARDLLKAAAGVRPGGTQAEKPVRHFSLSWSPSEKPTREEMIAATESLLRKLGWQEHQCVLWAHSDKPHPHVHVMASAIHPQRGTCLNDAYTWRRAEAWGLAYEQGRGKVYCEARLQHPSERQPSPPRPVWEKLRLVQPPVSAEALASVEEEQDGAAERTGQRSWQARKWRDIKSFQKGERLAFFEEGKRAYRDLRYGIYGQVRGAYRSEWREFCTLKRAGAAPETIAALRADLVARQGATLQQLCRAEAGALRKERDAVYRTLLDRQTGDRAELIERQEKGLASPHLWAARDPSGPNRAAETTPARPRETQPPPAFSNDEFGLHWTHRGGLAAQQRSASRWLDRAVERLSRPAPERNPPPSSRLAAARDRVRQKEPGKTKSGRAMAIKPDG